MQKELRARLTIEQQKQMELLGEKYGTYKNPATFNIMLQKCMGELKEK